MKPFFLFLFTLMFNHLAVANSWLMSQAEIKEEAYEAQLAVIRDQVHRTIKTTGSLEVYEDELSMAPLVVKIDYQKAIKVAQGANVIVEHTSWIDLEQATWGFQDAIDSADGMIGERLKTKLGGEIYSLSEETKSATAMFVIFPARMPGLNAGMPTYSKTLISFESAGFDAEDNVKATNLELAEEENMEGVVFFPYINIALHKQNATLSRMNGELMINYVAAINGYFSLCIKAGCIKAVLPNYTYIDLIIPLVHRKEFTSDKSHIAARKYGQELIAKMITEFTMAAFDKLHEEYEEAE